MNSLHDQTRPIRTRIAALVLSIAFGCLGAFCATKPPVETEKVSETSFPFKRMPDGKEWTTENLSADIELSYCYEDADLNCRRYGRLYTWESAQRACQSRGDGWRLPTEDEWRQLAKHYGGVYEDSNDEGKAAFEALLSGGSSGFGAVLGGGREAVKGAYARLEAHGFYWTASETTPAAAWFYNFGKGSQALYRQREGNKQMAVSVRCVRG